jgi:hypothetical protein
MYRIIGADGKEYGPIPADQLRQWIAEGRANASTLVLSQGATEWKTLGSLPEFSVLFAGTAHTSIPPATPLGSVSAQKNNSLALAGFILGLVSFLCLVPSIFCCCFGLPFNVLGIIFSLSGLSQINRHPQLYSGKGFAIAGLVLSTLCFLLYFVLLAMGIASSLWQQGFQHHVQRL